MPARALSFALLFVIFVLFVFAPEGRAQTVLPGLVESHYESGGINIAVVVPISSVFSSFTGNYCRAVVGWWAEQVRANGGVQVMGGGRRPLGWELYDMSAPDVPDDLSAYVSQLVNERAFSFLYTVSSSGFRALAPAVERAATVPLAVGFQGVPAGDSRLNSWSFAPGTPPDDRLHSTVDVLALKGARSLQLIVEEFPGFDTFTLPCANLGAYAASLRLNISQPLVYTSPVALGLDGENYTNYLQEVAIQPLLESPPADILVMCTLPGGAGFFLEAMRDANYNPGAVVAPEDVNFESSVELLGELADYVYGVVQWDDALRIPTGRYVKHPEAAIAEILAEFQRLSGISGGAATQDNVATSLAALTVIEETLNITRALTPDALQFAAGRVAFPSFYGSMRFGVDGLDIAHVMAVFQVLGNGTRREFVAPLSFGTGEPVFPAPRFDERHQQLGWYQSGLEIAVAVLTSVGIVCSLLWLIFVLVKWTTDPIRFASPQFLVVMLLGSMLMYASLYTWQLYETDAACIALPWLLTLGYTMFMGALLVKTFRIWIVLKNSNKLQQYRMPYSHVVFALLGLLLIPVVLLIVWSAVDHMSAQLVVTDPFRPSTDYVQCELESGSVGFAFAITLLVYCALLTLGAMLMSVRVWKVDRIIFNESVWILFSVYIIVIAAVILVALQASSAVDRETLFGIRSFVIIGTVFTIVCMIFAPKAYYVRQNVTTMHTADGSTIGNRQTIGTRETFSQAAATSSSSTTSPA